MIGLNSLRIIFLLYLSNVVLISLSSSYFSDDSILSLYPQPSFVFYLNQSVGYPLDHRTKRRLAEQLNFTAHDVPTTENVSPLFQGMGTHYLFLYVGTPPQRVSVIVDTGSHHTAFPCVGCKCGKHMDPHFDPKKSTTSIVKSCGANNAKCFFRQSYSEGSSWHAFQVRDKVWVGGQNMEELHHFRSDWSIDFNFGCQDSETGLFRTQNVDGIMGMSAAEDTFPFQLVTQKRTVSRVFSMCFRVGGGLLTLGGVDASIHNHIPIRTGKQSQLIIGPDLAGKKNNSKGLNPPTRRLEGESASSFESTFLGRGAIVLIQEANKLLNIVKPRNFGTATQVSEPGRTALENISKTDSSSLLTPSSNQSVAFARLLKPKGWYTIRLLDILMIHPVTGDMTSIEGQLQKANQGKGVIVDSGTTDTYLPAVLSQPFKTMFASIAGWNYHNNVMEMSREKLARLPTIVYRVESATKGQYLDLDCPPSSYLEAFKGNRYSPRIYLTEPIGAVLGANFMNGYNVIFDPDRMRLGFARSECSYDQFKKDKQQH